MAAARGPGPSEDQASAGRDGLAVGFRRFAAGFALGAAFFFGVDDLAGTDLAAGAESLAGSAPAMCGSVIFFLCGCVIAASCLCLKYYGYTV